MIGVGWGRAVAFMLGDNTNKILRLKALTDIGCRSIAGPDPDRQLGLTIINAQISGRIHTLHFININIISNIHCLLRLNISVVSKTKF